jgi:hypothetical protein
MKMEEAVSSKMLAAVYQITQYHNPENRNLNTQKESVQWRLVGCAN